ncbi:hypothetical protein [Caproiciproducens sp.]|uniref:hypothetical protein n=1 Tax=Caproiciproducens sp. TaxID=1954376 RepID=UPI002898A9BB|nr:hypothetical protein [Caproiciproducens sp.]
MPYELFWHGPISAYLQYRAAYYKRQEETNRVAWLHGAYITRAIAACAPHSKAVYPDRPIVPLTPEQEERRQQMEDMIAEHNEQMRQIQERQAIEFQQKLMEANFHGGTDH